jgi:hypothetical protein
LRLRPLWAHSLFQFRRKLRHWLVQALPRKLLRPTRSRLSRFIGDITVAGIGAVVIGATAVGGIGIGGMVDSTGHIMVTAQAFIVPAGAMAVVGAGAGRACISASASKQQPV